MPFLGGVRGRNREGLGEKAQREVETKERRRAGFLFEASEEEKS